MEHEQLLAVTFTGWVKVRLLHKIIRTVNQWAKFRVMMCLTPAGSLQTIPMFILFFFIILVIVMLEIVALLRISFDLRKKKGHFTLSSHTLMHCNVGVLQPSIKKD